MADNLSTSGSPILSTSSGSPDASIDPNSVRSRMSSILPTTLTSWFSPSGSGRNGRRRRSNDSDDSVIDAPQTSIAFGDSNGNKAPTIRSGVNATSITLTRAPATWVVGVPPLKRQKFVACTDELSFARDISHIPFSYSTPAPTSAALGKRRTLGDATSTPYQFASTAITAATGSSSHQTTDNNQAAFAFAGKTKHGCISASVSTAANIAGQLNGNETTEDEDVDAKRLRITESSSAKRTDKPEMWLDDDDDDGEDDDEDDDADDDEVDLELNGLAQDESASESCERFSHKELKTVAAKKSGRTRTVAEQQQQSRRISGFAASPTLGKGLAGISAGGGPLSFNAHLQTHKSLFSTPNNHGNRSASLNASTTSLNSLSMLNVQRRPALYGSTSALSDSRLLSGGGGLGSPFYNGRTMYGGASAYSSQRRAQSSQRTLRVPTQMRPTSSLSGASSSRSTTNQTSTLAGASGAATGIGEGGAGLQTSALSNTAKRILDLMNQFSTPLGDVRKMTGSSQQMLGSCGALPALVAHRRRFDDSDMLANRGVRLQRPQTPYTRQVPVVQPQQQQSAMSTQLQVPTMSTLMQMKKVLQNKTERVRELATASNSILNDTQPGVYKLPAANVAVPARSQPNLIGTNEATTTAATTSSSVVDAKRKMRNKITSTRTSTRNAHDDELPEPVHLPSVSLPLSTNAEMPVFNMGVPFGKSAPAQAFNDGAMAKKNTNAKLEINSNFTGSISSLKHQLTVTNAPLALASQNMTTTTASPKKSSPPITASFKFSAPLAVSAPKFASSLEPINTFTFSPPLNVSSGSTTNNHSCQMSSSKKRAAAALPLKTGSVLDALKKPIEEEASTEPQSASTDAVRNNTSPPPGVSQLPSLSQMFASKSAGEQWECDSCMLRNDASRTKCVACETAKVKATVPAANLALSVSSSFQTKGFQFAPAADTWECNACLVRNKTDAVKCVSCTTTKTVAGNIAAPVPTTFGAQFAPAISTWECATCMVRNKIDFAKCIACETVKPIAKVLGSSSFADQFKPSASTWECDACMVRNNADAVSCVACTSPKPGATAKPLGYAFSAPSAFEGTTTISTTDTGFASLVAKQSAKWECAACLTRNDVQRKKCECCELDKPGSTEDSAFKTVSSPVKFGNSAAGRSVAAATGTFSFGVPFDANAPAPTALKPLHSAPSTSFTFGTLAASDSSPKQAEAAVITSVAATSVAAAAPSFGGFAFGAAPTTLATADAPKATFSFGRNDINPVETTTDKTTTQGIKRPVDNSVCSTKTLDPIKKSEFFFGSGPSNTTVSFGVIKPADEADEPSKDAVAKSTSVNGGFSFGASTALKPVAISATTSAPNAEPLVFGATSVVASAKSVTSASSTTTPTVQHLGTDPVAEAAITTSSSILSTAIQSVSSRNEVTFGSEATKTSVAANANLFGGSTTSSMFAPPVLPESSTNTNTNSGGSAFIFGTSAATASNIATPTAAVPGLSFGQSMFGQPAAAKLQISDSKTTGTSAFGGFGAGTATFGAAAAPTASAPASSLGQTAATVTPFAFGTGAQSALSTPSLFAFGAATGSDEPQAKKMLGQSSQQKQPAFAFGATNNNTPDAKTPYSFSASTPTSFNFSAQSQLQQEQSTNVDSSQPYKFGAPSAVTNNPSGAAVFSFGSGNPETPMGPAFQFPAESNNIFLPTASATNTAIQQRRKARPFRRNNR